MLPHPDYPKLNTFGAYPESRAENWRVDCVLREWLGGLGTMRDWVADWKKWSRSERVLAVLVAVMLLALPFSLLLTAPKPGT